MISIYLRFLGWPATRGRLNRSILHIEMIANLSNGVSWLQTVNTLNTLMMLVGAGVWLLRFFCALFGGSGQNYRFETTLKWRVSWNMVVGHGHFNIFQLAQPLSWRGWLASSGASRLKFFCNRLHNKKRCAILEPYPQPVSLRVNLIWKRGS